MTRRRVRSIRFLIVAAAGAMALTGCAASALPGAAAPPASPPTAEQSATATPSATPVPTPAHAAPPVTCDTIIDEAGHQDLASTNLRPVAFTYQEWDYPLLAAIQQDGVVCRWGNSGDVSVVVGQAAMSDPDWEETSARLLAAGYVQDDSTFEGFMDGPDSPDGDYPGRGFLHRDGQLYYSSYADFLKFVPALHTS